MAKSLAGGAVCECHQAVRGVARHMANRIAGQRFVGLETSPLRLLLLKPPLQRIVRAAARKLIATGSHLRSRFIALCC